MELLMRKLAAIICIWTLAACGQPAAPAGDQQTPAQTESSENAGNVLLSTPQSLPDWLLVLRTNDGGTIHFNQRTITRENGLADIWLQVRYGREQIWEADTETHERVIRYELERLHYRFNCAEETFVVVERQIMGANEQVIARDEPRHIYRATPAAGAARHIMPIACRGA
jgi:hypothetical protein